MVGVVGVSVRVQVLVMLLKVKGYLKGQGTYQDQDTMVLPKLFSL